MEELTIQEPTRDEEDGWDGVGGGRGCTEQSSEVAEQKGAEGPNRDESNTHTKSQHNALQFRLVWR